MKFVLDIDNWEPGAPVLEAVGQEDGCPVVTCLQLAGFVEENRLNDPNGTWGEVHVVDEGPSAGMLCMTDSDSSSPDDWAYFQPAASSGSSPDQTTWVIHAWPMSILAE